MNETMGFLVPDLMINSAASSSAVPPISPIMMMPSVCRGGRTGGWGAHTQWAAGGGGTWAAAAKKDGAAGSRERAPPSPPHLWVLEEALQAVHKVGAIEGVPPDAHHGGLPQALIGRLKHSLQRQGVGSEGEGRRVPVVRRCRARPCDAAPGAGCCCRRLFDTKSYTPCGAATPLGLGARAWSQVRPGFAAAHLICQCA